MKNKITTIIFILLLIASIPNIVFAQQCRIGYDYLPCKQYRPKRDIFNYWHCNPVQTQVEKYCYNLTFGGTVHCGYWYDTNSGSCTPSSQKYVYPIVNNCYDYAVRWNGCAVVATPTPNPPTPTPVPVCKPLGVSCSGGGGNCCSSACFKGVCCKPNLTACSGGGGSCCSGYCNLSTNQCTNPPPPTPTPTPASCPSYNGQLCAGNPPGGQCQTSPTCSTLPVGGPCTVGGLPGSYAFNLCPGGGETRCCVPNPTPTPTLTPTPTPNPPSPTPTPKAWYKLRDSTLVGRMLVRSPIPSLPITPYDSSDPGNRVLIDGGSPGVLSGVNIEIEEAPASAKGWKVEGRAYETQYTVQKYIEYVRASKKDMVLEITNINQAESNKINILTLTGFSPVTLTDGQLSSKRPLFLIVVGDIDFEANINSSNEPQVIMSTGNIDFNTSVRVANGLYIANSLDFGLTVNQGIKVIGNIIAQGSFKNDRKWGDPKKPGLFIVFDPSHYLAMFDMLSSPRYDWRQLQ